MANEPVFTGLVEPPKGRKPIPDEVKIARGERLRALRNALGLTQDEFAAKANMPTWTRESVAKVETGKNAATSVDVQRALAAGADLATVEIFKYLIGAISLEEAMKERDDFLRGKAAKEARAAGVAVGPTLSANAAEAMRAFDWEGVSREEYERIHRELSEQHQKAGGIDPFSSWWTTEIRRLLREAPGTTSKVPNRTTDIGSDDEVEQEKERRKAAKAARRR